MRKKELSVEKIVKIEEAYFDLMQAYSTCLTSLKLKKFEISLYLFNWDNVPGNDTERLLWFLEDDLDIGWVKDAEIHKSTDGKTIRICKNENFANILINEEEEEATLIISDGRIRNLEVKKKNGKLNILYYFKPPLTLRKYRKELRKELDEQLVKKTAESFKFGRLLRLNTWSTESLLNLNPLALRFIGGKIKKQVDFLRGSFLFLIAQSRNKIDSDVIKNFERDCEDMDKLSAYCAKLGFKPFVVSSLAWFVSLLSVVISFLHSLNSAQPLAQFVANLSEGASSLGIFFIIFLVYALFYPIFFVVLGYFGSRRLFTENAIPEKDKKIFFRIREYLEFMKKKAGT